MRNLFALVGCAVVAFLGLGYYLGWYQVTPQANSTPGHHRLEIDVNAKKIGDDVQHGVEVGTEKLQGVLKKEPAPAAAKAPAAPPATPQWQEE
jgi:hypothetical protein